MPCTAALVSSAQTLASGARLLVSRVDGLESKALQEAAQSLQQQLGDPAAVVLATGSADGKVGGWDGCLA
jgi:hypothetical protein